MLQEVPSHDQGSTRLFRSNDSVVEQCLNGAVFTWSRAGNGRHKDLSSGRIAHDTQEVGCSSLTSIDEVLPTELHKVGADTVVLAVERIMRIHGRWLQRCFLLVLREPLVATLTLSRRRFRHGTGARGCKNNGKQAAAGGCKVNGKQSSSNRADSLVVVVVARNEIVLRKLCRASLARVRVRWAVF